MTLRKVPTRLLTLVMGAILAAILLGYTAHLSAWFQRNKPTRTYIVRVVDSASKAPKTPISHAKVLVEINDPAQGKKSGYTDAQGTFRFTWQASSASTKTHITVQAPGYTQVDEYSILIEDRIIELTKTQ